MSNLIGSLDFKNPLITGAILTVIIRIIWSGVSWLISNVWLWLSTRKKTFPIILGQLSDEQFEFVNSHIKFSCLIIRYGTDQYIKDMASEQEKYDGKLRNKVIRLSIVKNKTDAILKLQLPIHKRIGTQFKCFVEANDKKELQYVLETLETCGKIKLDNVSDEFGQYPNRLFFFLKRFGKVETVEGIINNMCFPE